MKMASNKKIIKKGGADEQRYTNALLENMDSKIDAILEDRKTLNEKIDRHHGEFKEFRNEVDYKFEAVFDELGLIRNDLKEKVSRDEFILLEKRVFVLERVKTKI